MKRFYYRVLFLGLTILTASCSPVTVETFIARSRPPLAGITEMSLFYDSTEIPRNTMPLGTLTVRNDAAGKSCNWNKAISMALEQTRLAGGNGLYIYEYRAPSPWDSPCHQFSGTMLHFTDPFEALKLKPDSTAAPNQEDNEPSYYLGKQYLKGGWRMAHFVVDLRGRVGWDPDDILSDRENSTWPGLGPDEALPDQGGAWYGWELMAGFFPRNYYGVGIIWSHNRRTTSGEAFLRRANTGVESIDYIGLELLVRCPIDDRHWIWNIELGLGCSTYYYRHKTISGEYNNGNSTFGFNFSTGIEYKFSTKLGAGVNVHTLSGKLFDLEEGYRIWGANVGFRYYF